MPYNSRMPTKHGAAEYNSWMQLVSGDYEAIAQGENTPDGKNEYFASLVYTVNPANVSLGASVGIDGSGDVALSGDSLKVFDEDGVAKLQDIYTKLDDISEQELSVLVQTEGNFDYIMAALPGTAATSGSSNWSVKRVYDDGSTLHIMYPSGDSGFNYPASGYLTFNYTF